ncbi:Na+/H+ antiporter subunit E [Nocardioides sp. Y6]|uniref:Na+/H+ antiporter subunit E n=1 Tax=Nocardioides malaquae TaxID=2773426 RepID=A0ABR9RW31_9ACTN|nr:Na+/H+ antiporter subunit E [Nocardioides malaquae]MBE7325769.1 Na+/H+ antiporter subunit E [Nocardioides malaquae]
MSPQVRVTRRGKVKPVRYRALQPWSLLWLTLFWVGLWGSITPNIVLAGVAVAVAVSLAFPLPPIDLGARVRVVPLVWLVAHFLYDIVKASILVSVVVLRRRPVRNAVVAVDLRSNSDFVLTAVGAMLTLVPGSIIVEARRSTHTLYLHVLDVDTPDEAAAFRRAALEVEARFLRAFEPKPGTALATEEAAR